MKPYNKKDKKISWMSAFYDCKAVEKLLLVEGFIEED